MSSNSNTIPPIDIDYKKMQYLLELLSIERLEKDGAIELRRLLLKESQRATIDLRYRKTLLRLIETLDRYIKGEVNLMPEISVGNISNVV